MAISSSTCSMQEAIPPRSASRVVGGCRLFGLVCPAPLAFHDEAEALVRFEAPEGVDKTDAPFFWSTSLAVLLAVTPFKLVSEERVLRFRVEGPAAASAGGSTGDGALLPDGVASVFESSAAVSSMTALLVEATGAGIGAFREICDRR